jgi:hypothetical protein
LKSAPFSLELLAIIMLFLAILRFKILKLKLKIHSVFTQSRHYTFQYFAPEHYEFLLFLNVINQIKIISISALFTLKMCEKILCVSANLRIKKYKNRNFDQNQRLFPEEPYFIEN